MSAHQRRSPLGPDTIHRRYPVIPDDPYDADVIAISTLQSRGYPVSLQPAEQQALDDYHKYATSNPPPANAMTAAVQHYKRWLQGAVHNPDFHYVGLDLVPEDPVLSEELAGSPALLRHPAATLVSAVSTGNPFRVHRYKNRLVAGETPVMDVPVDIRRVFLTGCFMAAMERYHTPGVGSYKYYAYYAQDTALQESPQMVTHCERTYVALQARGERPIGSEHLAGLTQDFYRLAEKISPRLAAMKDLAPVPVNPPEEQPYVY